MTKKHKNDFEVPKWVKDRQEERKAWQEIYEKENLGKSWLERFEEMIPDFVWDIWYLCGLIFLISLL